ncbi:MAG: hypothetical protein WCQ77_03320 [Planctomycetota bacterium]
MCRTIALLALATFGFGVGSARRHHGMIHLQAAFGGLPLRRRPLSRWFCRVYGQPRP